MHSVLASPSGPECMSLPVAIGPMSRSNWGKSQVIDALCGHISASCYVSYARIARGTIARQLRAKRSSARANDPAAGFVADLKCFICAEELDQRGGVRRIEDAVDFALADTRVVDANGAGAVA